ncbi:hypothetical protein [Arthrobacter sp. NicSoilC5]|uniref:hypothetical protein n=1 Tax=Arthrobacter sp. NicSoilC5 TaxID=2831000 RepID=UPI001CC58B97|nr:hypothetical protein [Arthrobacter sp. NicSoilC5]BCW79005.1 hypothetical protein NicSoilC5_10240 [Arthrobacter sp. NicSoilC5]
MPRLKNISPLGALDVPLLRRIVDAEEIIDVTEDQARVLLLQPDNYQPTDKAANALAADLTAQQDPGEATSHDGNNEDAGTPASGQGTEGEDQ